MSTVENGKPADEWASLAEMLRFQGGFTAWDVAELVRLASSQRAGVRVVERIEQKLAENGIGHLPPSLPLDGSRKVLLYVKSDPNFGFILHLISTLATQDPAEDSNMTVTQLEMLLGAMRKGGETTSQAGSR
ncbi:hypothetical protein HHL19_35580 [Streptomyces sp. R302]|uniref:hypothetical protein n=1 Tax=unclassified Streptomyces TaxID=2593676 RepID=UPI00145CA6D3|nr:MULTISPECIES: hypothetical protein [unclassified Streptomyces]NML55138.1 hypothetical protein [Streptomyces sp. R301]NML83832.1 hypothetical protein [Streptomyces sp. R302]